MLVRLPVGAMTSRRVIGRKIDGRVLNVVPSNPRGATPTTVIGLAAYRDGPSQDVRIALSRSVQKAWLRTTTDRSPATRSSSGPRSRPRAGVSWSVEK